MRSFKKSGKRWKQAALALCLLLALTLSGCSAPGFADYDVSGYIQALLDSSYHDSHGKLMEISGVSEEQARENNISTVENAAVQFCNAYGILPSDEQLSKLQAIMKHAFSLTKYTVKDERKVDTGYYLEVEIASITNFENREADIEKLKTDAQQEATAANTARTPVASGGDGSEDEDGGDGDTSSVPVYQGGLREEQVDANELFVEKVLEFCTQEVANISYDPETRTVALDIRQTEKGELQLDLNQIATIDQTVIRFSE